MTNTAVLEDRIAKSGFKRSFIAGKLGLTPYGFALKCNNKSEFKASEMQILCALLNISVAEKESIFFAAEVAEKSTNKNDKET